VIIKVALLRPSVLAILPGYPGFPQSNDFGVNFPCVRRIFSAAILCKCPGQSSPVARRQVLVTAMRPRANFLSGPLLRNHFQRFGVNPCGVAQFLDFVLDGVTHRRALFHTKSTAYGIEVANFDAKTDNVGPFSWNLPQIEFFSEPSRKIGILPTRFRGPMPTLCASSVSLACFVKPQELS
jgi:hypothetical protein